MKLKNILMAAAVLVLGSCTKSAIAPLDDVYQKPEKFNSTELVSSSVVKLDGVRCFNIELGDAGAKFNLKFYCDKYYLEPVTYSAADAASIKKGFYLVGEGGSTYTKDGKTAALDHGGISVSANGSNYSFDGVVWLADGNIVKLNAKATLVYEPDPEPVRLVNVLSANANPGVVSIQLAQDGISSTQNPDWSTSWTGEGYYLTLDLYSADGFLHEGIYKANSVGGVVSEGEFGIGYDTTVDWGWGPMEMKDWGTCWWTVANGATSAQKILSGTVTVSRNGSRWTIELQSGEGKEMIWTTFTGEIPALTDPNSTGEIKYKELTKVLSASNQNAGLITFQFATDGVSSTFDAPTWTTTYSGTGNYLALDIYSADGKLAPGTYNACATGGAIGAGEFGIGYDTEMWGNKFFNWGTCWWTVTDGATSAEKILDGTVTVSVEGGNYTVALQSSVVNARYTGPIEL
ncbi:MAG: hypothetical protein ACI3ZS_08355 [Candidatus Cryptobacteroides sp.]